MRDVVINYKTQFKLSNMLRYTEFDINPDTEKVLRIKIQKIINYYEELKFDERPQYSSIIKIFRKI